MLTTVPGIDQINALTIPAKAGDLQRFGHQSQFPKFCGLDLASVPSSVFRGPRRLSK
ncbi:transposase [Cognatishimia sp. F0-27]|nr:transposase [Cognatishimia sp. F0-27]